MNSIKSTLKRAIQRLTRTIASTKIGGLISETMAAGAMDRIQGIKHGDTSMKFAVPNALNRFRVDTFSTKEPETLEWVNRLPDGCTLWDVGANVGLYSVYAAKRKQCRVIAYEPSVFNLELLARNLFLNGLQDRVTIIPVALSDGLGPSLLRMGTTEWGGALSTFGKETGWDGKPIRDVFAFRTLGLSMDQAVAELQLPVPDFIKMDVDGIEHFILQAGPKTLSQVKGVLVEINDDFSEQAEISRTALQEAGLSLMEKRHSAMFEGTKFTNVHNQIWER